MEGGKERQRGGRPPCRGAGWSELAGKRGRSARSQSRHRCRSCRHCGVWAEPEGGGRDAQGRPPPSSGHRGENAAAAGVSLTFRGGRGGGGGRGLERLGGCGGRWSSPGREEEGFDPYPRASPKPDLSFQPLPAGSTSDPRDPAAVNLRCNSFPR